MEEMDREWERVRQSSPVARANRFPGWSSFGVRNTPSEQEDPALTHKTPLEASAAAAAAAAARRESEKRKRADRNCRGRRLLVPTSAHKGECRSSSANKSRLLGRARDAAAALRERQQVRLCTTGGAHWQVLVVRITT